MSTMSIAAIINAYRQIHEQARAMVATLGEDQLAWQPGEDAHSMAWNLWYLARWADTLQEHISRMTGDLGRQLGVREPVWGAEHLAERWGLIAEGLGFDARSTTSVVINRRSGFGRLAEQLNQRKDGSEQNRRR